MESQRLQQTMSSQFTTQFRTLVCVTDQMRCDRIIKAGKLLADMTMTSLSVISVAGTQTPQDPNSIEHLFNVSAQSGAEMSVIYSDDPVKTLTQYIKENKISHVLTGQPEGDESILYRLWERFSQVNFFTVDEEGTMNQAGHRMKGSVADRII